MPRSRLCRCCKDWHDLAEAWPVECYGHFGITVDASAGPQIISDTIEPFHSMADGRVYSSKSRYRAELKARGLIEVGNERLEHRPVAKPPVRETLRQVREQLGF